MIISRGKAPGILRTITTYQNFELKADFWADDTMNARFSFAVLRDVIDTRRPDFTGDFHPASREIKQERRPT